MRRVLGSEWLDRRRFGRSVAVCMQGAVANASQTRRQPMKLGMDLMHAVACWSEAATLQQP